MINYKWVIVKLDAFPLVDNKTNVVYAIHWECHAVEVNSDRTYVARASDVNLIPLDLTNFTEYESLTETQVLEWLHQVINKDHMEARLAEVMASEKQPLVVTLPLPWQQTDK